MGEEKEAERQEHEEKKFKEKSLKQYQHRLNTAIYAEEDQKIKEDKVLQHEIDLHNKNVTKHILQEQVSILLFSNNCSDCNDCSKVCLRGLQQNIFLLFCRLLTVNYEPKLKKKEIKQWLK